MHFSRLLQSAAWNIRNYNAVPGPNRSLHSKDSTECLQLFDADPIACIVYWQAREIDRVLNECDPEGNRINVSLLEHVSPIEWENVVLYGEYALNRNLIRKTIIA